MATTPIYYGDFSDDQQPTLLTVANIVEDARTLLQDLVPDYRYDDDSLLRSLNCAATEAARLRHDLWGYNMDTWGQVPSYQAVDDTHLDVEVEFRQALLWGTVAHALMSDQEDYQNTLATTFQNMFTQVLTGRNLGPIIGGAGPGRP